MTGERESLGVATYSPEDDTLRWSPGVRLKTDEYARVRQAGFRWWRGSEAWVAAWTPGREDFLLEFVEEIGHEADPDDPASRITRFAGRAAAAESRAGGRRRAARQGLPPVPETQAAWERTASHSRRWAEHLELRLAFERGRLEALAAAPFAPSASYGKGDMLISSRYGRVEVIRVGPKNVRVRILEGGARGMEMMARPDELQREEAMSTTG